MYSIAGIGSRETPQSVLDEMKKLGEWCKEINFTLRSGHAEGADWWFEQGAQEKCVAYLPWAGFNEDLKSNAKHVVYERNPETVAIARKFHPAYDRLSSGAKKMMERNVWQVLSPNLRDKVAIVVCWTEGGKAGGGTGQAIRIANAYRIPVIDFGADPTLKYWDVVCTIKTIMSF